MQQRQYPQQLLDAIKAKQYTVQEDGLDVLIKPIPDDDRPGVPDPRLRKSMVPMLTGLKGVLVRAMMKRNAKKKQDIAGSAAQMRQMMDGVKSIPIVGSVDVTERTVQNGDVSVPIRVYTPKTPSEGLQPVFYYIHGGGFVAGSMDVVDEMCKLVVEKTGCVAVQPQYRLAPENPFPAGLNDCYSVLGWIHANAAAFGGDPKKICVSGDSAGGNLAAVCAMRSRDDGTHMVKVQALLYPTVDAAHMAQNAQKNLTVYEISPDEQKFMNSFLGMMSGALGGLSLGDALGVKDDTDPYVSPSLGNLEGLPPTILLLGEYDFLRYENDMYAHKLQKAGVDVKLIRYRGLSHGFADQVGVTPQAEDALEEIGRFMMEHRA